MDRNPDPFLYKCPRTGLTVQGRLEFGRGEPDDGSDATYRGVPCAACGGWHIVNPRTRRLLAEERDGTPRAVPCDGRRPAA